MYVCVYVCIKYVFMYICMWEGEALVCNGFYKWSIQLLHTKSLVYIPRIRKMVSLLYGWEVTAGERKTCTLETGWYTSCKNMSMNFLLPFQLHTHTTSMCAHTHQHTQHPCSHAHTHAHTNTISQIGKYTDSQIELLVPLSELQLDPSVAELFHKVFQRDHTQRPTAFQLLSHPQICDGLI